MEGRLISDRYRLVRLLGRGGMGSVWLAEHTTLKSEVAIKLIDSELGKLPQWRARFLREAQLAARIKSAHVVHVHDHGVTEEGQPYIAMEHMVGISLRDRLSERGRLSRLETSRTVTHVCRALRRAHEAGLVHRDLKPENIFLAREADDEVAKVLDFGVAKAVDALSDDGIDPTRTGVLLGTPFYMSPEQAQGLKTVDFRSDLWSMGVVVFECLTGKQPFVAEALGPLISKILGAPIPRLSQIAPEAELSAEIDLWMAKALSRDPAARFVSAKALSEALIIATGATDSFSRDQSHPGSTDVRAIIRPMLAQSGPDAEGFGALASTAPGPPSTTLPLVEAPPPAPVPRPRAEEDPASRSPWIIAVVLLLVVIACLSVLLARR